MSSEGPTSQSSKTGLAPGTLVHVGRRKVDQVNIKILEYGSDTFNEIEVQSVAECLPLALDTQIRWVDIVGLHQVDIIGDIGDKINIHPLVLEDILHTNQRPKAEAYEEYLYLVLRTPYWDEKKLTIDSEQVSVILGAGYVITFLEGDQDILESVRERVRIGRGRIRNQGSDYLVYAIMDAVVDQYFTVLDNLSDRVAELEDEVVTKPTTSTLQTIQDLKHELISFRKLIWPVRELVAGLERGKTDFFADATLVYLRDVHDHSIRVLETTEMYRDMVASMLDIYISSVNNKLNEIMKVLTIIATLFIPLTFVTGVYGMNFVNLPGAQWQWGFYLLIAFMIAVFLMMVAYFRRRHWF
jgi:magnesium transporter